jgi:hypothetical protein
MKIFFPLVIFLLLVVWTDASLLVDDFKLKDDEIEVLTPLFPDFNKVYENFKLVDALGSANKKLEFLFEIVSVLCKPEANNNSAFHFKQMAIQKASNIIDNCDLASILKNVSVGYVYSLIIILTKESTRLIYRLTPLGNYYDTSFIVQYLKNLENSNDPRLQQAAKSLGRFVVDEIAKAYKIRNKINPLCGADIEKISAKEESFRVHYDCFNRAESLKDLYDVFIKVHNEKNSSLANSLKLSIITKFRQLNDRMQLNSMLISIGVATGLKPLFFHYLAMNANSDDSMRELIIYWDSLSNVKTPSQLWKLRGHLKNLICNEVDVYEFNEETTHLMVKMLKMIDSDHKRLVNSINNT